MNNIDIENVQDQSIIEGITVKTPKNIMISRELMTKVIQSLKDKQNAILEHANGTGRLFSLLCSSFAWLRHLKANSKNVTNSKTIKVVYVSHSLPALQCVEKQLKNTEYTPNISYFNQEFNQEFNIQNKNEDQLILLNYDSLINFDQNVLENSIMILDDFDYVQDIRILETIQMTTIKYAEDELDKLVTEQHTTNELDQKQNICEYDHKQIQLVKHSIQQIYEKFSQIQEDQYLSQEFFQRYLLSISDNPQCIYYGQCAKFDKYVKNCEQILKLSELKYFALWFKFIKSFIQFYQELQPYKNNLSIKIYRNKKQGKKVTILVKYYLKYLMDQFYKVKFHSILISSNCFFLSSQDGVTNYQKYLTFYQEYLNKFQIKQYIQCGQYFQTFLIQSQLIDSKQTDQIYNTLFMNLQSIINNIPNGILMIFSSLKKIRGFKQYCETQQPNFFEEIGKIKTLFWGFRKYKLFNYIQSSQKGAILFESYERILNKDLHFPGCLCKGLIFVEMKTINYHRYDQEQYQNKKNEKNYYLTRCINKIIGRSLLYENDKGALFILDDNKSGYDWREILSNFDYQQYNNGENISGGIQNDQQTKTDAMLMESYHPLYQQQLYENEQKSKVQRRRHWSQIKKEKIQNLDEKSQKIKKEKNLNKQNKSQLQQQRYLKNQQCEDQFQSNSNYQQQEEIQLKQENNFIQQTNDQTEKKLNNKQEKDDKKKRKSNNNQESTPKKNTQQEQKIAENQKTLFDYFTKDLSGKKSCQKDNQDSKTPPQI